MVNENSEQSTRLGDSNSPLIILSTFPSDDRDNNSSFSSETKPKTLESFLEELLKSKLIACANILPKIHSIYHWQGAIEKSTEQLLILKTTTNNLEKLKSRFVKNHPYDTPEFVAISPKDVNDKYQDWIIKNTATSS